MPVKHPVAVPVPQIVKVPQHVPVPIDRPVPVELHQQVFYIVKQFLKSIIFFLKCSQDFFQLNKTLHITKFQSVKTVIQFLVNANDGGKR